MITAPARWTLLPRIDGVTVAAPEGPSAGIVRYHERIRTGGSATQILAERLRAHTTFTPDAVPPVVKLETYEGEYGAFATVAGSTPAGRIQYALGLVFGDDFHSRIEGFCESKEHFDHFAATARELTMSDRHFLGHRRRRFLYQSNGWTPIARGFITDWIPSGFPSSWGMITVYPALPIVGMDAAITNLIQRAKVQHGAAHANPVSVSGLSGEMITARRNQPEERLFSLVALADERFLYTAELTSRAERSFAEHEAGFARLWQTFQPIPKPTAGPAKQSWPLPVE